MAVCLKLSRILRRVIYRSYSSSAAFPAGEPQIQNLSGLMPRVNLPKKLEEITDLQKNIERRKLGIDPVKLKSLYDFFKYLESTKTQLEKRRKEISKQMLDLKKVGNDNEVLEEIEKLKMEGRVVKEDLRSLMKVYWEIEEKVIMNGLSLPNELHKDTPENEDKIIHEHKTKPQIEQPESHIVIGQNLDVLDYRDPSCYYLKDAAAVFELACACHFADGLKSQNFTNFSNPDFSRSGIVEGCGTDHVDPNSVFIVNDHQENPSAYRLHLVGGASLYAFCAFHTRQIVDFSNLPLKYFTIGRQYTPTQENGLFGPWQKTACEIFALTADDDNEMSQLFARTLNTLISLYEKLGFHFRVVYLNAASLESWECLRASIQMYSCHQKSYIEVGKLSISDNYICQRLSMCFAMAENDTKTRYMKMVSGTAVDVTKVIGCLLEQIGKDEKFVIPDCLKSHSFNTF